LDDLFQIFLDSAIFVLPLWFGNAAPTFLGGGAPIDGGKYWRDGKRILGDGKTIRGFWLGVLSGGLIGTLIAFLGSFILPFNLIPGVIPIELRINYPIYLEYGIVPFLLSQINLASILNNLVFLGFFSGSLMTFGGLIGDIIGSFIKRRSGIERGHTFIFLDQLGFLVVGMMFVFPLIPWPIEWFLVQVPITFVLHIFANLLGYFTGIQDVPL
jgi:CDP-2,3-bis-(O-geranylgeranyl)-sn-glycerol synthase